MQWLTHSVRLIHHQLLWQNGTQHPLMADLAAIGGIYPYPRLPVGHLLVHVLFQHRLFALVLVDILTRGQLINWFSWFTDANRTFYKLSILGELSCDRWAVHIKMYITDLHKGYIHQITVLRYLLLWLLSSTVIHFQIKGKRWYQLFNRLLLLYRPLKSVCGQPLS